MYWVSEQVLDTTTRTGALGAATTCEVQDLQQTVPRKNDHFEVVRSSVTIGEAIQDRAKAVELCKHLGRNPTSEGVGEADAQPTSSKRKRSSTTAESSKRQKPTGTTKVQERKRKVAATALGKPRLVRFWKGGNLVREFQYYDRR